MKTNSQKKLNNENFSLESIEENDKELKETSNINSEDNKEFTITNRKYLLNIIEKYLYY